MTARLPGYPRASLYWAMAASLMVVPGLSTVWADAPPPPAGAFTIVVLPDTQSYLSSPTSSTSAIFAEQTRWIVEHREIHNIRLVLQEGDIVDSGLDLEQWTKARTAMDSLNDHVSYALSPGNHDYGDSGSIASRFSYFNDDRFFGPDSPYASQETVGGFFEPNRTDNSYHVFRAGDADWLVLALGFGPSDEVVEWANQVISAHPNHNVILVTHAYLYSDDTCYDWVAKNNSQRWSPHEYPIARVSGETVNDGQELWDKLLKTHPNVRLVFCGHVLNDGAALLTSIGAQGQVVHQMLANYQSGVAGSTNGGNGFMRLIDISPNGVLNVRSYSPHIDEFLPGPYQQFTLEISPLQENERPANLLQLSADAERLMALLGGEDLNLGKLPQDYQMAQSLDQGHYFHTAEWILNVKVVPVLESFARVSELLSQARTAIEAARKTGANPLIVESLEGCLVRAQQRLNDLDEDGAAVYLERIVNASRWQNISTLLPVAEEIVKELEQAGDRKGLMARADYNRALAALDECDQERAQTYLVKILGYVTEPIIAPIMGLCLLAVMSTDRLRATARMRSRA